MDLFRTNEKLVTISNMQRMANRRGKRDGKAEKPALSWKENSVPFISQSLAQFGAEAERRIASTRESLNARVYESLEREELTKHLSSQVASMETEIAEATERAKYFKNEIDGYKEENPMGRFARTKLVSDGWYYLLLLILAVGEVLVTAPALIQLFGDAKDTSYIIAVAIGILPVAGAHVLGTFLKSRLDRQRPQENWVKSVFIAVFTLLILAIFVLGVLRAGMTIDSLQSFNIVGDENNDLFLLLFFVLIQLAFFSVAITLAFMHYSPSAEAYKHAKRELNKLKTEESTLAKTLMGLRSKSSITTDEIDAKIRSLRSEIEILQKEYEVAVSVYREANIHARRDEIDGSHSALQAPKMLVDLDKFADVYSTVLGRVRVEKQEA